MSEKQQLLTILNFMGESEASQILQFVKDSFRIKFKTWDDVEEDEPTPDEIDAIDQYLTSK